mgnify:CR=1 FL=1
MFQFMPTLTYFFNYLQKKSKVSGLAFIKKTVTFNTQQFFCFVGTKIQPILKTANFFQRNFKIFFNLLKTNKKKQQITGWVLALQGLTVKCWTFVFQFGFSARLG